MVERELRCKRCGLFVPIQELKYEKTGTHLICAACRGQETEPIPKRPISPTITTPIGGPKTLKYQCARCHYTFRRSPNHPVTKCPNCGNTQLLKYEKVSADDVLKMTEDKRFEGL